MNISAGLIKACIQEDRRAQSELYRKCYGVLMGVCIRYARREDEAATLLNQGFLKILQNLEKRKENAPFEAWIRRIMINTVIDAYRKNKKYQERQLPTDFNDAPRFEHFVDFNEADRKFDAAELEAMILRLPAMSRQVFNLYAIDGYSHKDIAKMLKISEGTSKWHVSFARKRLKGWLAERLRVPNP